ncbi:hypothetical protein HK100_006161 [Physocladia obscura]|uniref:Uncharacterized protein n=1 Tax=Physocladia obscura TaxID=109957 RepID=A0AAD5XJ27_9FUNG|nr:hypothetical protein HK100_006161 [Physocladia obscura]
MVLCQAIRIKKKFNYADDVISKGTVVLAEGKRDYKKDELSGRTYPSIVACGLLSETQDIVSRQSKEIAVLKKALVEYSTAGSSSVDSSAITSSEIEPSILSQRFKIDQDVEATHLDLLIKSLSSDLTIAHKKIEALKANLLLKSSTIESLQITLETTQRDFTRAKDDILEYKKQLHEQEESLNAQASSVVDEMLVRATRLKTKHTPFGVIINELSVGDDEGFAKNPETLRGRSKQRIIPISSPTASKSYNRTKPHLSKYHTVSSTNKKKMVPTKLSITTPSNSTGRNGTLLEPHQFSTHPTCTKHARSHSYDSYLKQLMASKVEYKHVHEHNMRVIQNVAAGLTKEYPSRKSGSRLNTSSSPSKPQLIPTPVSTINANDNITIQRQRQSIVKAFGTESSKLEFCMKIPNPDILVNNRNNNDHLDDNREATELKWLDLSTTTKLTPENNTIHSGTFQSVKKNIFESKVSIKNSKKLNSPPVQLEYDDGVFETLTARATRAEMERDALEEELLEILKVLNKKEKG